LIRRSSPCASFIQSSASRSQASPSLGFVAWSAFRLHSAASRRNLSVLMSGIGQRPRTPAAQLRTTCAGNTRRPATIPEPRRRGWDRTRSSSLSSQSRRGAGIVHCSQFSLDPSQKGKPRRLGRAGLVVGTCPSERWGPDPRNQPLGCGVTATDWRLYTADHRQFDGVGNSSDSAPAGAAGEGRPGGDRAGRVFF